MGLAILEPSTNVHVAGTVLLNETAAHSQAHTGTLKHASGRDHSLILAPQPSQDPNDPLNWSSVEKHVILGILCYGSIVCAACLGPLLSVGTVQIATDLSVSLTDLALLSGYLLLVAGSGGPFVSALARKYGKRHLYIFSSTMAVVGCIAGECAHNYNQLLASRIIQGFAQTAYESLIIASIGDLFFVHERGARVSVVMFILTGISCGVSIIAGPITANLGWVWNFHILLPFMVVQLILLALFVPETTYRRQALYEIDVLGSEENLDELARKEIQQDQQYDPKPMVEQNDIHLENIEGAGDARASRKPFFQRMSLYNGVFVEDSIFKMILACVVVLLNVGALYNIVVSGVVITWFVATSVLSSVLLTPPPYLLTAAGVGYMSVGPLLGGILGTVLLAVVADPWIKTMAKKNRGVYEPEFRLPLTFPGLVTVVAGLVGMGYALQKLASVYVISFAWGVALCGFYLTASVTTGYALDAFREHSTELFIMNMLFKNFFFYGLTEYIINWYLTQGPVKVFGTMAGISGGLILTTIPMYVFGKKYRYHWQHHNLIKVFRLETDKTGTGE